MSMLTIGLAALHASEEDPDFDLASAIDSHRYVPLDPEFNPECDFEDDPEPLIFH